MPEKDRRSPGFEPSYPNETDFFATNRRPPFARSPDLGRLETSIAVETAIEVLKTNYSTVNSGNSILLSSAARLSFAKARASICRTRSLVTPNSSPTSFKVSGSRP